MTFEKLSQMFHTIPQAREYFGRIEGILWTGWNLVVLAIGTFHGWLPYEIMFTVAWQRKGALESRSSHLKAGKCAETKTSVDMDMSFLFDQPTPRMPTDIQNVIKMMSWQQLFHDIRYTRYHSYFSCVSVQWYRMMWTFLCWLDEWNVFSHKTYPCTCIQCRFSSSVYWWFFSLQQSLVTTSHWYFSDDAIDCPKSAQVTEEVNCLRQSILQIEFESIIFFLTLPSTEKYFYFTFIFAFNNHIYSFSHSPPPATSPVSIFRSEYDQKWKQQPWKQNIRRSYIIGSYFDLFLFSQSSSF